MKIITKVVSYIFHPLLLPSYATMLIIMANPYWFYSLKNGPFSILAIITPLTFGFPVITVLLMKGLDFIDDLHLRNQKQRFIPFIAIMVYYIWAFMVIKSQQWPNLLLWMMLGSCIAIVLGFISNMVMKISLHAIGAACLVSVAISVAMIGFTNMLPFTIMSILIAGLIGTSRLFLNEHEPQEVYSGYMIGFLGMMISGIFY